MSKRKPLIIAVVVIAGIAGYAFRPERLFINQRVNQNLPTVASAATTPQPTGLEFVLGNKVMVGTVNANRGYFETGARDMARAEAEYPGWLSPLLAHRVKGLENYGELLDKLTTAKGAIKVFCEVAPLG